MISDFNFFYDWVSQNVVMHVCAIETTCDENFTNVA